MEPNVGEDVLLFGNNLPGLKKFEILFSNLSRRGTACVIVSVTLMKLYDVEWM